MKILVIRPDAIGDLVLTLPAIQAVKEHFPQAEITALIKPYTKEIAEASPVIDKIIYDYNLKKYNFDLSINFFNEFKDTWATFISGIPKRVGDSSRILTAWMNNIRVFRDWTDQTKHEVEQNLELLKPLGIKTEKTKPILKINQAAITALKPLLPDNFIAIHIGSATEKAWTPSGFATLINRLGQQHKLVILGGKKELKSLQEIKLRLSVPIIDLVGQISLTELMAVISQAGYFIGMSTGATHIAATFGLPTVMISLNKKSPISRWHPWQTKYEVVTSNKAEKVLAAVKRIIK